MFTLTAVSLHSFLCGAGEVTAAALSVLELSFGNLSRGLASVFELEGE